MARMAKELKLINVNDIVANENQPRKYFDTEAIMELAESIKGVGIIQPLSVSEGENNKYDLISGERRLKAAKIAGLTAVPCVIIKAEADDKELISLVENIQREDLNYIEEARAYRRLMEEYGFTQQQLAERVGKKQSTISNKIRLIKLGDEVLSRLIEYKLTERHARALLQIPDTETRLKAVEIIKKNDLSVKQTEQLAERLKGEVLINSGKTNVKNVFNYKIYTNTIKQAYEMIARTGMEARYFETCYDDRVEIKITIPID
jgi:ParB family chromosome partitioning protein